MFEEITTLRAATGWRETGRFGQRRDVHRAVALRNARIDDRGTEEYTGYFTRDDRRERLNAELSSDNTQRGVDDANRSMRDGRCEKLSAELSSVVLNAECMTRIVRRVTVAAEHLTRCVVDGTFDDGQLVIGRCAIFDGFFRRFRFSRLGRYPNECTKSTRDVVDGTVFRNSFSVFPVKEGVSFDEYDELRLSLCLD